MRSANRQCAMASVALLTVAIAGCRDELPTKPSIAGEEPTGAVVLNVIGSSPTTMGWLAPLGNTSPSAPQDVALRPVVTICRWINSACTGTPVAQFSIGAG